MTMTQARYTFHLEGLNRQASAVAATQREAHAAIWASLTDAERDACRGLDWVDTEPPNTQGPTSPDAPCPADSTPTPGSPENPASSRK